VNIRLVIAGIFCCAITFGQTMGQGKWSNAIFRGNYQRTGVVDEEPVRRNPVVKWRFKEPGALCAPVIYEAVLYTGEGPVSLMPPEGLLGSPKRLRELIAIDVQTRKQIWSFQTQGMLGASPLATPYAIYFGTESGILYAVDRGSGKRIWQYTDPRGIPITTSPVFLEGVLYYATAEGDLRALSADNGKLLWSVESEEWKKGYGDPAVLGEIAVRGNDLVFVCGGDSILVVDRKQKRLRWRQSNRAFAGILPEYPSFPSCSVGSDGLIYFLQEPSLLRGEPCGTRLVRTVNFPTILTCEKDGIVYRAENPIAPFFCVTDQRLYLATHLGRLYAIDIHQPPARSLVWEYRTDPGCWFFSPSLARGVLYVGLKKPDHSGSLLALDAEKGEKLWEFELPSFPWQPPVVEDGVVYIGTAKGELYAIEEGMAQEPSP